MVGIGKHHITASALRVALALALTASALAQDWTITPGKRAGPIRAGMSKTEIVRLFGAQNFRRVVWADEMGEFEMTALYPDDDRRLLLEFAQSGRLARVTVLAQPAGSCPSRWSLQNGVKIGTTLPELQKLNSAPFGLVGFGTDGSGSITDWRAGTLRRFKAEGVAIRMHPPTFPEGTASFKRQVRLLNRTYASSDWRSDSPLLRTLHPTVDEIAVTFLPKFTHHYVNESTSADILCPRSAVKSK
jgi:hypothetical protein